MTTAELLLPDLLLILLGAVLCRRTALNRPVWQAVEPLVYYVFFPVLLFDATRHTSWQAATTGQLALASLAVVAVGVALTTALAHWPGVDVRRLASGAQTAFRFNSFVGLALAERLGGVSALGWMAVCIGLCVPLVNIAAVWSLARHAGLPYGRELLRNPLILSTAAGILAQVADLRLPDAVDTTLHRIGLVALPLGLMATGASLRPGRLRDAPGLAAVLMTVRHAVLPLVAWGVADALALPAAQRLVVVLFAALPTSSATYVLAARMGGDAAFVAGLVTLSTLLATLSLPGWLWLLTRLG